MNNASTPTCAASDVPSATPMPFTRLGFVRGVRDGLPLALSVAAFGSVFGVLANQAGLSALEAFLMSALVYAGSSQVVAMGLWHMPLPILPILLSTAIVNLRYVLMGVSFRPWLNGQPLHRVLLLLFTNGDGGWALAMRAWEAGDRDAAYLLGANAPSVVAWLAATVIGHTAGARIADPTRWGLDFAFTAVVLAALVGLWRGRASLSLVPWLAAGVVAFVSWRFLGGQWYIVLGGLAGALAGWVTYDR